MVRAPCSGVAHPLPGEQGAAFPQGSGTVGQGGCGQDSGEVGLDAR